MEICVAKRQNQPLSMITYFETKIGEIFEKSANRVNTKWNLARKKMFFSLVFSVIELRNVHFTELALKINPLVETESNLRRIQMFFSDYDVDYRVIAVLLMGFIDQKQCRLSIDRTNWKFGSQDINFLVLTVYYKGVGIPILFHLLDKKGNSNHQERIDILGEFIEIFGRDRILSVVGDREFIGKKWLKWLINKQIEFSIRVPKSHQVTLKNGQVFKVEDLLSEQSERYFKDVIIDDVRVNIAMKTLPDDYLIVIGTRNPKKLFQDYKYRWSIETFFQSIKERGFNMENTHLQILDRLKKLFAIIAVAFVFCLHLGIHHHGKVQEIKTKNHGYKANSFFRKGLDKWRRVCVFTKEKKDQFELYAIVLFDIFNKNLIRFACR